MTTATTTWNLDPAHSVAEFKVKHMMISNVKGSFPKVTGVLTLDETDLTKSTVEASIEVDSITTNDAQRDGQTTLVHRVRHVHQSAVTPLGARWCMNPNMYPATRRIWISSAPSVIR